MNDSASTDSTAAAAATTASTAPAAGPATAIDADATLAAADLRVLLMVLVHMTGDTRWLEPPFCPKRDVRLIPDAGAGLPPDVQQAIREAARPFVLDPSRRPAITDPGDTLMQRMMSVCLGEKVPAEYAPMNREEMALAPRDVRWTRRPDDTTLAQRQVLIVGAGVCGLALAVALSRLGIPFTIVDAADDVGGVWHANRYPGCGVDTPNHSYSYSFGQRHRWTRYFSQRGEIHDYLRGIAERFGLRTHLRLRTTVVAARWDAAAAQWETTLQGPDGRHETKRTAYLVSGVGQLNDPSMPRIDGADRFDGRLFHSSRWPADLDVAGKRIAIIGTGATAMQAVPAIAPTVASVTVYQRSRQWARPIDGYSDRIGDGGQWLLEHLPFYAEWFRFNMFWRYGDGLLPLLRKDPTWPHPDRAVNATNDRHRREMTDYIRSELGGRQDLFDKCVPDYPPYGKRILLDAGWYRALTRPNVELVETPIRGIREHGIETTDGRLREADVIVYATGFSVTRLASRLNLTGRDGQDLATVWDDDNPTAYLGLTTPGFPNFFGMLGPNSGPGHGGSVIFQAECQVRYITSLLTASIEHGDRWFDVRRDVHDAYVAKVDAEHEQLIWSHPGMSTYYRNRRGRVFSVMPWRFVDYWAMTHDARREDYERG